MKPILGARRRQAGAAVEVEVEREGMGMSRGSRRHGFGWWRRGKLVWDEWRFGEDTCDRLLVGNDLLKADYKNQWRALKDIRDVHFRMWQAQRWVARHGVARSPGMTTVWLEYLHSTVIELF